jgi:hypothetical protein
MKRSVRTWFVATCLGLAAGALLAGCEQGEGDRCQVDADCQAGLVCNRGDQRCSSTNNQQLDAEPIPDGAGSAAP